MADENTAVNDLIQGVLSSKTKLEPDPADDLFVRPEISLRSKTVPPPIPSRLPSATPALPITRSQPAAPEELAKTVLGQRAPTAQAPTVGRAPTRPLTAQHAIARQPVVGRAPTQDFSRTTLGQRPPTERPAIARTPTAQPVHTSIAQPAIARTPTAQPVHTSIAQPAIAYTPTTQPVVGRAPSQDFSRTTLGQRPPTERPAIARAPTAQPIPSIVGRAPSQDFSRTTLGPYATVGQPSHTQTPPTPAPVAPVSAASVGQPVITWTPPDPQPAVEPARPTRPRTTSTQAPVQTSLAQPRITSGQSTIAPISSRDSALAYSSTMLAQPAVVVSTVKAPIARATPEIALPPYTPAPNVGDPGELDSTMPVDRVEFTELVDRYDPILRDSVGRIHQPAGRDSILDIMPPRFDFRALAKQSVQYLPLFAAFALVLVFLGGYLAFDDSGSRKKTTEVTANEPAPTKAAVVNAEAKAEVKADVKADGQVATDKTDDKATDNANRTDDKATYESGEPNIKLESEPTAAVAPKPTRGKLYVAGDSSVQIYLNGRSADRTAPSQFSLMPGTHKVTLWNQKTGKTTTQFVTIVSGETIAIR